MACSSEFIVFVNETLSPLGEVSARKMMGDYLIYLNGKCIATACDNCFYIKIHPCIEPLMHDAEIGKPYPGAKECYILDLSDQKFARRVISILWDNLPFPKKKIKQNI